MNPRAGLTRPTPLAGAPLRPLEYYSNKSFDFSYPCQGRMLFIWDICTLQKGCLCILSIINLYVNTLFFFILRCLYTFHYVVCKEKRHHIILTWYLSEFSYFFLLDFLTLQDRHSGFLDFHLEMPPL